MANGNINVQQDPREILGQLIARNLGTLQSEEGEKVLRKFFKTSAEEIVNQPGGAEVIAASLAGQQDGGTTTQPQQQTVPQQTSQPSAQSQQRGVLGTIGDVTKGTIGGAFGGFFQGAGQQFQSAQADIEAQQLENIQRRQAIRGETPLQSKDINEAILKNNLDIAKEQSKVGVLSANNIFTKFEPVANNFQGIIDSFSRVQASIEDPSAAGDLALIFNFMKILDPNSVVRESEFATAQNAASVPERVRAIWNNVLQGERLSVKTRKDIAGRASKLFKSKEKQFEKQRRDFTNLAIKNNINPQNVLRDPRLIQIQQPNINEMSDEELQSIAGGQ